MPEPFKASKQFGDFVGTVSFDGHVDEVAAKADIPADFQPIGFQIRSLWKDESDQVRISIHVVAVQGDKVGESIDSMISYGRVNGQLPAKRFRSEISFEEFIPLMQRVSICAKAKSLENVNMVIVD